MRGGTNKENLQPVSGKNRDEWDELLCHRTEVRRKDFLLIADKLSVIPGGQGDRSLGDMALHMAAWKRTVDWCQDTGFDHVQISANELILLALYYQYGPLTSVELGEILGHSFGKMYVSTGALKKKHFVMLYGRGTDDDPSLEVNGLTPNGLVYMMKVHTVYCDHIGNAALHKAGLRWEKFKK